MAAESVFDKALDIQKRTLPASGEAPEAKLTCFYYPNFVAKQLDSGEIGAELSITSIDAGQPKPPCRRQKLPAEKAINPTDWGGYFKGAKGDYAFFDAEDGVNGGLGFAVFCAGTVKKLFEDSALGGLHALTLDGDTLTLRYTRSFAGKCSVLKAGAGCWNEIAAAAGLDPNTEPDCITAYHDAKIAMAKGRCEADGKKGPACMTAALKELDAQHWNDTPSVITYEAETVLGSGQPVTKPLGGAVACHPSD
jgi:hypothetical protein